MIVKLLTEHHLDFLSLKRGRRSSSQSKLVKISNCWKSHAELDCMKSLLEILVFIALVSSQGADEAVHLRSLVRAFADSIHIIW